MSHRARKRFGQNFLTDETVIDRIVEAIRPAAGQRIIEIGPGQAALTGPLADSGAQLDLLEIDRDLAATLRERFAACANVRVHEGDALELDFAALTGGQPFRLVGNLPYNISTPLLFHVLRWSDLIEDMHFMLQKEVVERLAAEPGGKTWGRLSVMVRYHCAVTPLFDVPPEAFRPPPRVTSAVVRLVPHPEPPVALPDRAALERVVSRAFAQRRKTLRNSLRGLLDPAAMQASGIDPGARPETLSLEQFAALARALEGVS
jgi:16S rRNA (adenine1518-N6/adenine1519-N6)-dimethyltransferase